jgi:hypothetical protein
MLSVARLERKKTFYVKGQDWKINSIIDSTRILAVPYALKISYFVDFTAIETRLVEAYQKLPHKFELWQVFAIFH